MNFTNQAASDLKHEQQNADDDDNNNCNRKNVDEMSMLLKLLFML